MPGAPVNARPGCSAKRAARVSSRVTRRCGRKCARSWRRRFSPEQIAGTPKRIHPGEAALHASHETIYTAIYAHPKGALRRELVALLRQGRGARRPRTRGGDRRGRMANLLSIHLRPPEANERLLPGHWEGDLVKGAAGRSAVWVP